MKVEANIGGMDCGSCAAKIEKIVGQLDDVQTVDVDLTFSKLRADVRDVDSVEEIRRAVEELGYTYTAADENVRQVVEPRPKLWNDTRLIAVVIGAASTIAAVVSTHLLQLDAVGVALYVAAILSGGVFVFRNALGSLRHAHLDINVLMTIAVFGAMLLGEWLEAATVVVLFAFAEWLEGLSMDRARGAIRELMELAPLVARVRHGDHDHEVPVEQVAVGAQVSVRPGERIPLDGRVVEGRSAVDQSAITGESIPAAKEVGDEVFAGSMNDRGHLVVEVTAPASESTIAHVIRAIESAQANRAKSERFIERFTRWYTPAVVLIAAAVAVVPPLMFGGWEEWFYRALVLLVISCPCALVIATPITTVSSLARSARDGVLVKGGVYIEALADLGALVFDKTGTLTKASLRVGEVVAFDGSEEEVLAYAAAVERLSEHYLARAIVREADHRGVEVPSAHSFHAHAGEGVEAQLGEASSCGDSCGCSGTKGEPISVGAPRFFESRGIDVAPVRGRWEELESRGSTVVGVARGERLIGLIECRDEVREEAHAAVARLREIGIGRVVMCTGDNRAVAMELAGSVGIYEADVHADLLPEDKVAIVTQIAAESSGKVAMVGDGINDAPALAAADVGIAMGAAGTDVALETAHVALMGDDLERLPAMIVLARRTVSTIRQNVVLALGIKAVVLALAVAGYATIWLAIAADMGTSLLVIANGMKLLRAQPK